MTIIGKRVTIEGNWLRIADLLPSGVNIGNISKDGTQADVFGEQTLLQQLKTKAEEKGYVFTIGSDVTVPIQDVEIVDTPTFDADKANQAFKNVKEAERVRLQGLVQTEYESLGGTGTISKRDYKWLR